MITVRFGVLRGCSTRACKESWSTGDSWEVWGEPQNLEDPHQSLHVVACWPASPTEEQAAALRSRLLERIPTHCRIRYARYNRGSILATHSNFARVIRTHKGERRVASQGTLKAPTDQSQEPLCWFGPEVWDQIHVLRAEVHHGYPQEIRNVV
jgi:hypothetical protein